MRKTLEGSKKRCIASLAACLIPLLGSCDERTGEKLYSRSGSVEVTNLAQLNEAVSIISDASKAPVRDRDKDLDGYPMFLLSNGDVTIFLRKRFGEACEMAQGCRWDYSISATNTTLDAGRQKQAVDSAFKAVSAPRV